MTTSAIPRRLRALRRVAALAGVMAAGAPGSAVAAETPLDNAPVPSLCGHPAGTLVDGELPGIPENQGHVSLAAGSPWRVGPMIASGRVRRRGDLAAVLTCSRGGVAWPDHVVFYDRHHRIIGTVDLYDVTRGGREAVDRIRISRRTVHVDVVGIAQDGDIACCGSASAKVAFRWSKRRRRMVVAGKTRYTEPRTVKRLLSAVRRGRGRAARKLAARPVVSELVRWKRDGARITFHGCHGRLDDEWWIDSSDAEWLRACTIGVAKPGFYEKSLALHVDRAARHRYKVTGIQAIAG